MKDFGIVKIKLCSKTLGADEDEGKLHIRLQDILAIKVEDSFPPHPKCCKIYTNHNEVFRAQLKSLPKHVHNKFELGIK